MTLDSHSCYRALRARDARFDGRFFVAVSSTSTNNKVAQSNALLDPLSFAVPTIASLNSIGSSADLSLQQTITKSPRSLAAARPRRPPRRSSRREGWPIRRRRRRS